VTDQQVTASVNEGAVPPGLLEALARAVVAVLSPQPVTDGRGEDAADFLTASEFARRLGVSRETVRRLAIAGVLPHTVVCRGARQTTRRFPRRCKPVCRRDTADRSGCGRCGHQGHYRGHSPPRSCPQRKTGRGAGDARRYSAASRPTCPILRDRPYQDHLLGEGEWCLCAIISRLGSETLNACSDTYGLAWTSGGVGIRLWTVKIRLPFCECAVRGLRRAWSTGVRPM
jgi:excisionase family DNA binding protein